MTRRTPTTWTTLETPLKVLSTRAGVGFYSSWADDNMTQEQRIDHLIDNVGVKMMGAPNQRMGRLRPSQDRPHDAGLTACVTLPFVGATLLVAPSVCSTMPRRRIQSATDSVFLHDWIRVACQHIKVRIVVQNRQRSANGTRSDETIHELTYRFPSASATPI